LLVLAIAGSAAAAIEVLHDTVKGDNASVSFSRDAIIECGDGSQGIDRVDIFVTVNEFVQRGDFNTQFRNDVLLVVSTENTCTGQSGSGQATIEDPDFHISAVQMAHLTGAVTIFDSTTGAPLGEASFDLDFEGVGTPTHNQFHQRLDLGALVVVQHTVGAFSDAAVTGTFTFNGVELIDSASGGRLGKSRGGTNLLLRQ
jgi:hypothetical protein